MVLLESGGEKEPDLEEPQETERDEKREVGLDDLEPEPEHDKGDLTEKAIEDAERKKGRSA